MRGRLRTNGEGKHALYKRGEVYRPKAVLEVDFDELECGKGRGGQQGSEGRELKGRGTWPECVVQAHIDQ